VNPFWVLVRALDPFSRGLTNQATIMTTHIIDNRFIKAVAANTHRFRIDNTVQRDNGDLGRTTTDDCAGD
jgi:hypothetical protein